MTTEHDQGDYVLVHKSKAKISRARKMIIGVMAIGAVAALTGAGTFASFTAQTTNSATFKTTRLVLSNTRAGTTCFSSGQTGNTATQDAANLDTNNNSGCDALFNGFIDPGDTATAGIDLSNVNSNAASVLSVYTKSGCIETAPNVVSATNSGSDTLCDDITLTIQTTTDASYNSGFTCVYPASNCATVPGTLFGFASLATGSGSAVSIDTDFGTGGSSNAHKFVLVTMSLPHENTAGGAPVGCGGGVGHFATQEISSDGNGTGCDNVFMDRRANFDLVWRALQS